MTGIATADAPRCARRACGLPRPWDLPTLLGTLRATALLLVAPDEADPLGGTGRLSALRGLDRRASR